MQFEIRKTENFSIIDKKTNFITLKTLGIAQNISKNEYSEPIKSIELEIAKNNKIKDIISQSKNNINSSNLSISDNSDDDNDSIIFFIRPKSRIIYKTIKRYYGIFKKYYKKYTIECFIDILNVDEIKLLEFCKIYLSNEVDKYYHIFFDNIYKPNLLNFTDINISCLECAFINFEMKYNESNGNNNENEFSKDDIFSYLLKLLFDSYLQMESDISKDITIKRIYNYLRPSFWLSINILYFIHYHFNIEVKIDNSEFVKLLSNQIDNNSDKSDNKFIKKKRNRILNKIENEMKIQSPKDTIENIIENTEKKIFRDIKRYIKEHTKGNKKNKNPRIKEIKDKDQDQDFWEELVSNGEYKGYNFKKYNQKLMKFLFDKKEFRELYKEYKKDEKLWHGKKSENSDENSVGDDKYYEFYMEYKKNLDQIYIEENSDNSYDNNMNVQYNNPLNNISLNSQSIKKEDKSININFHEKKGWDEMLKDFNENDEILLGTEFNILNIINNNDKNSYLFSSVNNSIRNTKENKSKSNLFNSDSQNYL